MLQDIRQSTKGTAAKVIIALIVISFAFFGIESILLGGSGGGIGEVNGEEISAAELQQAVNMQRNQLINQMGENIDPSLLEEERVLPQAKQAVIARKLLMQAADNLKLTISNKELSATIANMEQFQVDGAFSPDLYKQVLSNAGFTPASFKASLYSDMLINQLRSGIAGSEFATEAELAASIRLMAEQRDLRFLTITKESLGELPEPTEDELQDYYANHKAEFMTPESVDLDYIQLTPANFIKPVEEADVVTAYEEAMADFKATQEHRVSHILLAEGSAAEIAERLAQALGRIDSGEAFAEVAADLSDDVGSVNNGGDLGFTSGEAFPEEMEEVIAQLEVGAISEPIKTDAGTHLITVTERRDIERPSLGEMRPQLTEMLAQQAARTELLRTVEELKDLSFNAEDLDGPAEALSLTLQRANAVTRYEAESLLANPALLEAAFSEEVLQEGHNSDVIELADNTFVALRVRQHHEPALKSLDEVKEEVKARLITQREREALTEEATKVLTALSDGADPKALAEEKGYDIQVELAADRRNPNLPREILSQAFTLPAPAGDAPSREVLISSAGDAIVLELLAVIAGDLSTVSEQERQQLERFLSSEAANVLNLEYQQGLRTQADIRVI